jgi:hypothetical protein
LLGKTPHKENSRENSCPRAGFNGRYEVVQEEERTKGKGFRPGMAFYRRGRWSLFLGGQETLLRGGMTPFSMRCR